MSVNACSRPIVPNVVCVGFDTKPSRASAIGSQRADVGGGVRLVALEVQPQRGLARHDRAAHAAGDPRDVLRRLRGGERVAGVQRVVAKFALMFPFHACTFGRVMISIGTRPASWLSAANELLEADLTDVLAVRQSSR